MKTTLILTAAAAATLALRRSPAALRCQIWILSFAAILVLPLLSLLTPPIAGPAFVISSGAYVSAAGRAMSAAFPWERLIAAGSALLLLRTLLDMLAAWRLVRSSRPAPFSAGIEVRLTRQPISPMAWCFGKPLVLLPEAAEFWSAERLRAVLAHEAAHAARRDGWTLLLARVVLALNWFNPLLWLAWMQLRREMEWACDDAVLQLGVAPAEYADHLVAIAAALAPPALMPCATGFSKMEARVKYILNATKNRKSVPRAAWWAAAILTAALVLPLAGMQDSQNDKVYKIGGDVQRPRLIERVEPAYTEDARERKVAGTVVLALEISREGRAENIRVTRSLDPGLDIQAKDAVLRWRFAPGTKGGEPVRVAAQIEIRFKLK